ncbi:MAG: hypothetical protein ACREWE_10650 [Gammaproteobacteria bacterium]
MRWYRTKTPRSPRWLHGIVHALEGDLDNARYWYRKADRVFPGPAAVQKSLLLRPRRCRRRWLVMNNERRERSSMVDRLRVAQRMAVWTRLIGRTLP